MEADQNAELEALARPIIADLISLEPVIARYSELMRSFYDDWSGLRTTTNVLKYIIEHQYYGSVLMNYTFGEREEKEYDLPSLGGVKYLVVRKSYPDPDRNARALFALYKLMTSFPPNVEACLLVPSHKTVSQAKKNEILVKRNEIILCLGNVKKVISKYERLRPHLEKLVRSNVPENQQCTQTIAVVQQALEKTLK